MNVNGSATCRVALDVFRDLEQERVYGLFKDTGPCAPGKLGRGGSQTTETM